MPEGVVGIRLQTRSLQETVNELENVRSKITGVSDAQITHAKSMQEAGRQARQLNNLERQKTQIYLAQHPALNNLSRAMSTFGSISRSVLAVTSAFNLAMISFNTSNSRLTELQARLREVERQMALTTDPEKWRELADEAGVLKEQIDEVNRETDQTKITNLLNWGAAISLIGGSGFKAATGIAAFLAGSPLLLAVLGAAAALAAVVAGTILAIALAFYLALTPGDQFQQFVNTFFPQFSQWVEDTGKIIDDVFTMHIPNAFIFMANSAILQFNTVVKAAEMMVNAVVDGINTIIKGVNAVAGAIGLPKIGLIKRADFSGAMAGFIPYMESRNWGARGPGTYSGAGAAAAARNEIRGPGGFTVNVTQNVAGSVVTQRELADFALNIFKEQLKKVGFTGY